MKGPYYHDRTILSGYPTFKHDNEYHCLGTALNMERRDNHESIENTDTPELRENTQPNTESQYEGNNILTLPLLWHLESLYFILRISQPVQIRLT